MSFQSSLPLTCNRFIATLGSRANGGQFFNQFVCIEQMRQAVQVREENPCVPRAGGFPAAGISSWFQNEFFFSDHIWIRASTRGTKSVT